MHKVTTLNQFIVEQQAKYPDATGDFSRLLHHVGIAAKKVNREVNKAGLVDILGRAGAENVQGEDQQKLDVYADNTFIDELRASGECCAVVSEEKQDIIVSKEGMHQNAKYIFCMDPWTAPPILTSTYRSGPYFLSTEEFHPKVAMSHVRISYRKGTSKLQQDILSTAPPPCWSILPGME